MWLPPAANGTTTGGIIKGSGSYVFAGLMTQYLHAWQAQHNDTTFTYSAVGDAQGEPLHGHSDPLRLLLFT